jgi:hypothetical protein
MNTDQVQAWLRQQAEEITRRGADVREAVSNLTAGAAQQLHRTREGLVGICRAVLDGAVAGARQAAPAPPEGVLKEVIAGLVDGLSISAKALELTVREAGSRGTRFAREDLDKAAADLREVREKLTASVQEAAGRLGAEVAGQLGALADHAKHTLAHAAPALEGAISAAAERPVRLGAEAAKAGAGAAREAAGALFSEIGRRLEQAGKLLRRAPE